jgi:cell wall-associated NlpC family hydrolase
MTPRPPRRRLFAVTAMLAGAFLLVASPATAGPGVDVTAGDAFAGPSAVGTGTSRAASSSFDDVPSGYWAGSAIEAVAASQNWMRDFGSSIFKPDTIESRRLLARALVRAFAPTQSAGSGVEIGDVPVDAPSYPYIAVAVKNGWMSTTGPHHLFRPTDPATMQAVHRGLVLALGLHALVDGVNAIHTADGYQFHHSESLGTTMVGMLLGLRFNHSPDESLDVGPKDPMPRSEVAWSLYQAWLVHTSQTWRASNLASFQTITLPKMSDAMKQVVEFGLEYVGYPYVYAGEWPVATPSNYCCGYQPRGGFDCSGLTWWLVAAPTYSWDPTSYRPYHGWTLPQRSSADMAGAIPQSQRVAFDDLQPGDLMFYASDHHTVNHVDVYIGNGYALDSGSQAVTIQRVSSGWYRDAFMWGRDIMRPAS